MEQQENTHFLKANQILSLKWGLLNFDGIETDLRITSDNKVVIHHDYYTSTGDIIEKTESSKLLKQGVPLLKDFLADDIVIKYLTSSDDRRSFWLEIKTPCPKKGYPIASDAEKYANTVLELLDNVKPEKSRVGFISFNWDYLKAFNELSEYKVYPIMPTINECTSHKIMVLKALPGFFAHSLSYHINKAKSLNFGGIFFSKLYVEGFLSFRHPSYKKLLSFQTKDFILGIDVNSEEEENKYRLIHRFTDRVRPFPRHKKNGEGDIIAHRGVGIKGISLDEKEWKEFIERVK